MNPIAARDYHEDLLSVIQFCKSHGFYYSFIGEQEDFFWKDYEVNRRNTYQRYELQIDMLLDTKQLYESAIYTLVDRLQDIDQYIFKDPYDKIFELCVNNNIELDLIKELNLKCETKQVVFNTKYINTTLYKIVE